MNGRRGRAGAFGTEPPRERPKSPPESYGVPRTGGSFIEWSHVLSRLAAADAYWIATVTPGGRPHVVPIWGVLVNGDLYLETGAPETVKNRNLERNQNVVVHLDGAADVVLVRGRAEEVRPTPELGRSLALEFHAKYSGYEPEPHSWAEGGIVRIVPNAVLAWAEMHTATRWRFPAGR